MTPEERRRLLSGYTWVWFNHVFVKGCVEIGDVSEMTDRQVETVLALIDATRECARAE